MEEHIIPPAKGYTHSQPNRENILVDVNSAVMSSGDFLLLTCYALNDDNRWMRAGDMWKERDFTNECWRLCWISKEGDVMSRRIVIMDWKTLMGVLDQYDPVTKKLVDRVSLF